jgi:serine/threonine protein kinase
MELEAAIALLRCARRPHGSGSQAKLPPGTRIGNYEIVGKRLAKGGTGDVYPATELTSGGRFALKVAQREIPLVHKIFQEERHKARLLNHPNILGAHDGGLHEGRPYLVFRQLEGHLTGALRRERYADERAMLGLMQKVVGAVRFAHGRTVLHCDLNPSNILFDSEHEPHVADFGLARTLAASGSSGEAWGGTRGWMSPEQVAQGSLGVQTDIYTLGVIMYWLLTAGRLPYGDGNDFERRQREEDPDPIPQKGRFAGSLSWDLAAICLKAQQKQPEQRYQTAAELESDLERAARGQLPTQQARARARGACCVGCGGIRSTPWGRYLCWRCRSTHFRFSTTPCARSARLCGRRATSAPKLRRGRWSASSTGCRCAFMPWLTIPRSCVCSSTEASNTRHLRSGRTPLASIASTCSRRTALTKHAGPWLDGAPP